jgi:hypothetical protein
MKPNYLVIGAQNCGTTSLCANLGKHPNVFMTTPKELHFFSDPKTFAKGWSWYERYFDDVTVETAIGEGSTTYTRNIHQPDAPGLIAKHLPDARLIYMVRHPLRRMETHWLHRRRLKRNPLWDFERTYAEIPWMLDASLFWKHIRDPNAELARCFEFLRVDHTFSIPDATQAYNPSLGRRADKRVGRLLRRMHFPVKLWHRLPLSVKGLLQPHLTKELNKKPAWTCAMKEDAIEKVSPDMRRFLAFYGKPEDYWVLD